MPFAYFTMIIVAFIIIYMLTVSDKKEKKDELSDLVDKTLEDYHKLVELKEKLDEIDPKQLAQANYKLDKLKEEKFNKKEN